MLSILDLSSVKAFTADFVNDLHRIKTNGILRKDKQPQILKRIDKVVDSAIEFERDQKLNLYKKAQFLINIRAGLTEKSWPAEEVERVVQQLLTRRLKSKS